MSATSLQHNDNNLSTGEPRYGRLALQYRF